MLGRHGNCQTQTLPALDPLQRLGQQPMVRLNFKLGEFDIVDIFGVRHGELGKLKQGIARVFNRDQTFYRG